MKAPFLPLAIYAMHFFCRLSKRTIIFFVAFPLVAFDRRTDADNGMELTFQVARRGAAAVIPVNIGSERHEFLLDTGSSRTSFDVSLKHLLAPPTGSERFRTPYDDEVASLPLFTAPPVVLAGKPVSGVSSVWCLDYEQLRLIEDQSFTGVLGMDALSHLVLQIDFDRGKLRVLQSVPHDAGRAVRLYTLESVPSVRVLSKDIDMGFFRLDTGQSGLLSGTLSSSRFKAMLVDQSLSRVGDVIASSAIRTTRVRCARLAEFELGGFRHSGLVFSEGSHNSLSLGYLSRYVVTFDFPRQQMFLSPGARLVNPERCDLSGLHLRRHNGDVVVNVLDIGSAAASAGLHKGDVILNIGGVRASALTMLDIRRMLATPSTMSLIARRGSSVFSAALSLSDLPAARPNAPSKGE